MSFGIVYCKVNDISLYVKYSLACIIKCKSEL